MHVLEIYDPAMCCSTGVCGPDVDPALVSFAADLKWLESRGVAVLRYNLGQDAAVFAANPAVVKELQAGLDRLPIIALDGRIFSAGVYPSRAQLAQTLGIDAEPAAETPAAAPACVPGSGCC